MRKVFKRLGGSSESTGDTRPELASFALRPVDGDVNPATGGSPALRAALCGRLIVELELRTVAVFRVDVVC